MEIVQLMYPRLQANDQAPGHGGQALPPMLPEPGAGAKPPAGAGPGGMAGPPQPSPPAFNPDAPPPPHGAYQYPPGHPYIQNPLWQNGQDVYPGAAPPGLYGGHGPMGGPRGGEYPRQAQAVPPGQGFHVGPGGDPNYMGAMVHPSEAGLVRDSSLRPGGAEQRNSSLHASSATITNITKMSWTDFQKCASDMRVHGTMAASTQKLKQSMGDAPGSCQLAVVHQHAQMCMHALPVCTPRALHAPLET